MVTVSADGSGTGVPVGHVAATPVVNGLSTYWYAGSPLPQPRIFQPASGAVNSSSQLAVGTKRPLASRISTFATMTSPTVSYVHTALTGSPAVSMRVSMTLRPFLYPIALTYPGLYVASHSRWPFTGIFLRPSFLPLTISWTSSQLLYAHTDTFSPSWPSRFQCGSMWSTGSDVHHDLR